MSGALVAKTVQLQRRQEEERYMMANGAFSKFVYLLHRDECLDGCACVVLDSRFVTGRRPSGDASPTRIYS